MRKRSRAREYALQLLYQREITTPEAKDWIEVFWKQLEASRTDTDVSDEIKLFARELVERVEAHRAEVDQAIESCAEHWVIDRMAVVDRNILRIGAAEILFNDDVPTKVAINESIELAKRFGDSESSRFVNGILDQVAKKHTAF